MENTAISKQDEILKELTQDDYQLYSKLRNASEKANSTLNLPLSKISEVVPHQSNWNIERDNIEIVVIGAGGTGGYLIRDLCRFIYSIQERVTSNNTNINIVVYDGDIVEQKNILRQNFLPQDIGQNKAEVITTRHSRAFGVNISYVPEMFSYSHLYSHNSYRAFKGDEKKRIFIGCVDNNASRREIATVTWKLQNEYSKINKDFYWIDSGNEKKSGQVIVGSPNLQDVTDLYPEILLSKYDSQEQVSCADRMLQDEQNMFVNLTAANLILNYTKNILLDISMVSHGSVFNIDNKFDNYYITKR